MSRNLEILNPGPPECERCGRTDCPDKVWRDADPNVASTSLNAATLAICRLGMINSTLVLLIEEIRYQGGKA